MFPVKFLRGPWLLCTTILVVGKGDKVENSESLQVLITLADSSIPLRIFFYYFLVQMTPEPTCCC